MHRASQYQLYSIGGVEGIWDSRMSSYGMLQTVSLTFWQFGVLTF